MSRFTDSYTVEWTKWDERIAAGTQPWGPFLSIPFLICANVLYLGVTFGLCRYMQTRNAFNCASFKKILLVYNFTCVILAGYVAVGILYVLKTYPFQFVCNKTFVPGSKEDPGYASLMSHLFYVFYAQKFWEFLDTWFFILRKSFRQVTFLHVFHHCSINIVVGLILPFEFSGDMYLPILLNAIVHVLMYSHYLVSALGLSTPWKPYLTSCQLMQFTLIATQSARSLMSGDSCGGPYFGKAIIVSYMGSMLLLFGNFFFHSYVLKKPSTKFGGGVVKRMDPMQVTKTHSGRVSLDADGSGKVELPSAFAGAEINYHVTPIGRPMPNLHISTEPQAEDCSFGLAGGIGGASVSWTVSMVVTFMGEPPKPKPPPSCCGQEVDSPTKSLPSPCGQANAQEPVSQEKAAGNKKAQ